MIEIKSEKNEIKNSKSDYLIKKIIKTTHELEEIQKKLNELKK